MLSLSNHIFSHWSIPLSVTPLNVPRQQFQNVNGTCYHDDPKDTIPCPRYKPTGKEDLPVFAMPRRFHLPLPSNDDSGAGKAVPVLVSHHALQLEVGHNIYGEILDLD